MDINPKSETFRRNINDLLRHITNVEDNARLLADRLIDEGELGLAKDLMIRARKHDLSKFKGVEWQCLVANGDAKPEALELAVIHHREINDHHPEYFTSIGEMSDVQVAEMTCDLKARSEEMGTDLRKYVKDVFMPRYKLNHNSRVYRKLKRFMDLLLDPLMTRID